MEPNNQPSQSPEAQPAQPIEPSLQAVPADPNVQQSVRPAQVQPSVVTQDDPGKVFGILSICLGILSAIGLTLGIIGLVKSRTTGRSGMLSIIGIVLSVVWFVAQIVGGLLLLSNDSFLETYCKVDPTLSDCQRIAPRVQSPAILPDEPIGTYDYAAVVKTTSFSSESFGDLVNFQSQPGADRSTGQVQKPGAALHRVSIKGVALSIISYDASRTLNSDGRFGEYLAPNTTRICDTDYQNHVSIEYILDPPGGDGNTAWLRIFDQTNCVSSSSTIHGPQGEIKVSSGVITVQDGVPQASRAVAEGIAAQMRSLRAASDKR